MDAVSFAPVALPPLTVTPSQLSVTAPDSISTRQTPVAVPAAVSSAAVNTDTGRSAAVYIAPTTTQTTSSNTAASLLAAQSIPSEENIPGVVALTTQSEEFTPAVQYDQLVADSLIKYKPSYAGLPQSVVSAAAAAASAYQSSDAPPTPAPQVNLQG